MLLLDATQERLDRQEREANPARQFGSRELASEMQRLENELRHQVASQPRLFERARSRKSGRLCGLSDQHNSAPR